MPRSCGWTSIWGCNHSEHSSLKGPKSARHLGLHQRMSFRGIPLFRPHDHNCIAAICTCNSNSVSSCFVSPKENSSDARGKTPFRGSANPLSYLLSMGNLRYSKKKKWHCQYFPKPRATNKNKPVGLPTMLLFLIIC